MNSTETVKIKVHDIRKCFGLSKMAEEHKSKVTLDGNSCYSEPSRHQREPWVGEGQVLADTGI